MKSQAELVEFLEHQGVLKNERVREAFLAVDRKDFVSENKKDLAYINEALPIGLGQTISQPYVVAFMLDLLGAKPGANVLEIGYGSGWQTDLLAHIVGPTGHVYAMEVLKSLCTLGKGNLSHYPALEKRATLICKSAASGLPSIASKLGGFDRIIGAAGVKELPSSLREELKVGGVVVYPKNHSIMREEKTTGGWKIKEYPGFVFVPFVT